MKRNKTELHKMERAILAERINKRAHEIAKRKGLDPAFCIFEATDEIGKEMDDERRKRDAEKKDKG